MWYLGLPFADTEPISEASVSPRQHDKADTTDIAKKVDVVESGSAPAEQIYV